MSDKAKGRIWEIKLPHNEKWVLLAMADHSDHEGRGMYVGHDLIAYKTDYDERNVIRLVRKLMERGILKLEDPTRRPGPHNSFYIDWGACQFKPPFERELRGRPPGTATKRSDNLSPVYKKRSDKLSPDYRKRSDISTLKNGHLANKEVTNPHKRTDIPTRGDDPLTINHIEPFKEPRADFSLRSEDESRPDLSPPGSGHPPLPLAAPGVAEPRPRPKLEDYQQCGYAGCNSMTLYRYCGDHGDPAWKCDKLKYEYRQGGR
jgi:hypothetical protein